MRTSLNETQLIDGHLFNGLSGEDSALFNAMLIVDPGLSERVGWQKMTHEIITQYSHKKLKAEIEVVHQKLFTEEKYTSFHQRILKLFR